MTDSDNKDDVFEDVTEPRAKFDLRDPRLLGIGLALLVVLSVYNTIALHIIGPGTAAEVEEGEDQAGGQDPVVKDGADATPEDDASPTTDGGGGVVSFGNDTAQPGVQAGGDPVRPPTQPRNATAAAAAVPQPPVPAVPTDEAELDRLLVRAEQEMDENQRVLSYIYFANNYRKLHKDEMADVATSKAEAGLDSPLRRTLLSMGDALRDKGDLTGAREAYYLHLCRAERLGGEEAAATYFRIADLAYRSAMNAGSREEDGS